MTLAQFNELWGSDYYPPDSVVESDLRRVEQHLDLRLPDDYRQAVLAVGLPRPTIALLDAIVERKLDLHDVSNFYSPQEIIGETNGWHEIGMPEKLIAFASDCSGNKFCFHSDRLKIGGAEASAIWFYDHDFETVIQIAPSFNGWIAKFCQVEPLDETGVT